MNAVYYPTQTHYRDDVKHFKIMSKKTAVELDLACI